MKSFRLFIPKPNVPLADGAETEYSSEELNLHRAQFRPIAVRYRRCERIFYELFGLLVVFGICMFVFQQQWMMYATAGSFLACVGYGWCWVLFFRLPCPGCRQDLEQGLGEHCPECGHSGGIRPAKWFQAAKCEICGMRLDYDDNGRRAFKIRACTHCGLPLDDKGV